MKIQSSPIETHKIKGCRVDVKREDLATPYPGPPFSKTRGLWDHLTQLKKEGVTCVGYTETSISMAGWGVAWACYHLEMKCVIFDPQYKETPSLLKWHRRQWKKFGAEIIPLQAGMAKVNWYISAKILKKYPNSVLLPLGLPFENSIEAAAKECGGLRYSTVVSCVGSGTIFAGLCRGFSETTLIGVLSRSGELNLKLQTIYKKAKIIKTGFLANSTNRIKLIDEGWEYTDICKHPCPFPCHPYYDRKAWKWLCGHVEELTPPILFWNIGSIWR